MYMFSFNHKTVSLHVIIVTVHRSVKYEPILTAGVGLYYTPGWDKMCLVSKQLNLAAVGKLYEDSDYTVVIAAMHYTNLCRNSPWLWSYVFLLTVIVWASNSAVVGSKNSQEWPMKVLTIALWLLTLTYVLKLTIGKGPTLKCVDAQ